MTLTGRERKRMAVPADSFSPPPAREIRIRSAGDTGSSLSVFGLDPKRDFMARPEASVPLQDANWR